MFNNFEFQQPLFLLLLLLIPVLIAFRFLFKEKSKPYMQVSTLDSFGHQTSITQQLKPLLFLLRLLAFTLLIVALARPRKVNVSLDFDAEKGIDIMLVLDTSGSMLVQDFHPDRLGALKREVTKFIEKRPVDRIGLVQYSGEAVLRVPLTTDKDVLIQETNNLENGQIHQGTVIGVGMATGINHLKDSSAKSKIMILITDGYEDINYQYNLVYEPPLEVAEIAKKLGIKVYTIGIGSNGYASLPLYSNYRNFFRLDEELLKEIASITDGKYYRAKDNKSLENIYSEIDRLEKSEIKTTKYYSYKEYFSKFLFVGFLLLLLELGLRSTVYKSFV